MLSERAQKLRKQLNEIRRASDSARDKVVEFASHLPLPLRDAGLQNQAKELEALLFALDAEVARYWVVLASNEAVADLAKILDSIKDRE